MASTDNQQHIEAEIYGSDAGSSYGGDLPTASSITSSLMDYEYENGRRYHSYKKGIYFMPNDEEEQSRLDLVHHMCTLRIGGKLHLAPLSASDLKHVLDIGTGTGIWAIQMGGDNPDAQILANDLVPVQPSFVPPNVQFEVDDVEEEWTHDKKFDFIHSRYLQGAIRDWPKLIQNIFNYTKPGGWVELQDFTLKIYSEDDTVSDDDAMVRWAQELGDATASLGMEGEAGLYLEQWVTEAGFTNIHHEIFPFPIGSWPKDKNLKEIGRLNLANFVDGMEGYSYRIMTQVAGWEKKEVDELLAEVKKDLKNRHKHPMHDLHIVYAQKPLDAK